MDDKFAYLGLNLYLLLIWLLIFARRRDLRHKLWKGSILGGLCGLIAEFWYHTDYWQPPVLIGFQSISLEDFLFGFTILGISITIYDFVMSKKNDKLSASFKLSKENIGNIVKNWTTEPKYRLFLILFLTSLISLLILSTAIGIPSIIVSSIAFLVSSGIIFFFRPDLIKQSILNGILLILLILPTYIVLFDVLFTSFWMKYWLLADTPMGILLLGNIPWTELLWYFSLGILMGGAYEFVKGYKKVDL